MIKSTALASIVALLSLSIIASTASPHDATPLSIPTREATSPLFPQAGSSPLAVYEGNLKVYMSEPTSRFTDLGNVHYDYGFLNFAADLAVSISDGEVYSWETDWNAISDGDFAGVTPDNIVAQAVVSNATAHIQYSDPPTGNPFFAYYTDAAAEASVGVPGQNSTEGGSTHTVLIEEVTQKY